MMLGFVLLLCKDGTEEGVAAQLRTERGVEEVCRTHGPYDTIVKLKCKDNDEMRSTIYYKIRRIDDVKSAVVLTSLPGIEAD